MLPTVIETSHYQRQAARLLTLDEREDICAALAYNPALGVVVPGTEGARKMR